MYSAYNNIKREDTEEAVDFTKTKKDKMSHMSPLSFYL